MITGDHPVTAEAIASEIGIIRHDDELVLTGPELEKRSDHKLQDLAPSTAVYARVSPEHKQRIVQAHQINGEVVAMTGVDVINGVSNRKVHGVEVEPVDPVVLNRRS